MASQRVVIPGHLVPALKGQHALALTTPTQALSLVVGLNLRNRSSLDALLKTQDDPHSKFFHHYLTPQQFTTNFGPLPSSTQAVSNFLTSQGLHVTSVSANHAFISASGSVQAVERAFAINIVNYPYRGRLVYAPTNEPSVPNTLAGMIQGISGLDDVAQLRHQPLATPAKTKRPNEPGGCQPAGYGPSDFRTGYDIGPLTNNGYDGTGQYLAIVAAVGYSPNNPNNPYDSPDLDAFRKCFVLPNTPYDYVNAGGPVQASFASVETVLDMEVASEIAPGAHELIFVGSQTDTVLNMVLTQFDTINTDNRAKVVTDSWGIGCENEITTNDRTMIDLALTQSASQGIAVFVATDDFGVNGCNSLAFGEDAMSADPHVVAVGGTQYTIGSTYQTGVETSWAETLNGQSLSSGGGISQYFVAPTFQNPYYSVTGGMRGTPDVSADAYLDNVSIGYASLCTLNFANCSGWQINGGASAATPLWAGIAVEINQYLAAHNKVTLGPANALLYQIAANQSPYAAFRDITSGPSNGKYYPLPGYDLTSGLGTPDAWNLAVDIAAQVYTNIESDAIFGTNFSSSQDLMLESHQSNGSGWTLTDVSSNLRQLYGGSYSAALTPNIGQPGVVRYTTQSQGTEVDAFALANDGLPALYGFAYLPATGSWTSLGNIALGMGSQNLPLYNPSALAVGTPNNPLVAVYGITSGGHLIEYYVPNSSRPTAKQWNFVDLSQPSAGQAHYSGTILCNPQITPAVVVYNGLPVIFADCNSQLTEFYGDSGGKWNVNTGINGNSIPHASQAFPHHSIAALVVPGNPAVLEAYVASDQSGVSALSEYLYNGSAWSAHALPVASGHVPDQVHAQTVDVPRNQQDTFISEVVTTDPASTSCTSQPASVQYLYQPALPNPAWHATVLPGTGATDVTAIVTQFGQVFTEAFTGGYIGTSSPGGSGGGGCNAAINEDFSTLSSATTQSWSYQGIAPLDNMGVEPVGTTFPY